MTTAEQRSLNSRRSVPGNTKNFYEIRVGGILDDHWKQWFEGMSLKTDEADEAGQGCTLIVGPIVDQPALYGILERIRDLNLTLISIRRLPDQGDSPDESQ